MSASRRGAERQRFCARLLSAYDDIAVGGKSLCHTVAKTMKLNKSKKASG